MIQQNGDTEKCKRETTYKRHPFLEWFLPEPPSARYSGEYYLYFNKMKQNKHIVLMPQVSWKRSHLLCS